MELINIILHLDHYLKYVLTHYHAYFYLLFFLVIFCETGLVVTPFLPGDSLLFVAGAFAGSGQLQLSILIVVLMAAAFLGDNVNFLLGKFIGKRLFANPNSKIFRQDLYDKTHNFFEKYGASAIIMARFLPIVRTFAPFVAGVGQLTYRKFIGFSLFASSLWVVIFLIGGYFFGNIPVIKEHLSVIILSVVGISALPMLKLIWEMWRAKARPSKSN